MKNFLLLLCLIPGMTLKLSAQKTSKVSIEFSKEMLPLEMLSKDKKIKVSVTCSYIYLKEKHKNDKVDKGFADIVYIGSETEPLIVIPGYQQDKTVSDSIRIVFEELEWSVGSSAGLKGYFPLKTKLTITDDKGKIRYDDFIPRGEKKIDYSPGILDDTKKTVAKMQVLAQNKSVELINTFLKNNYGFNTLRYELSFYDVKDKKQTYPEYHKAIEVITAGFSEINTNDDKFISSLKEAKSIWETALKEFDINSKEARINKDIAAGTYLNIAQANIWLHEYDKARENLIAYQKLDENYTGSYNKIKNYLEDHYKRFNSVNY